MTEEERQILFKDLCARLPYGVKILHEGWNYEWDDELSTVERVVGIDYHFIYTKVIDTHSGEEYRDDRHPIHTFNDKLFLRPMSSMTEEERVKFSKLLDVRYCKDDWKGHYYISYCIEIDTVYTDNQNCIQSPLPFSMDAIDWLNSHHFDYRGLIEKGLALEAPEDMYNI